MKSILLCGCLGEHGAERDLTERFTDTWVKMRGGQWQCVASHGSTLKVHAAPDSAAVRRQIEPLLSELMRAANAHDTDRFLAMYAHEPSLVYVFNGTVIEGWENLRKQQLKWWNDGKSDVVYSQRAASVFTVLASDIAVVTCPRSLRVKQPDGRIRTGNFVVTMVWKKSPAGWRIVYGHESTVH